MTQLHEVLEVLRQHPQVALRDAALAYAAAGLSVFPCVPGGKSPLTGHGFREATTSTRRVSGWWAWQPNANIGIATGHRVDVLDIDVRSHGDGYAVLERLHRDGLVAGAIQSVLTPTGGVHLYFPSDPVTPHRSWARGTSHVDFRGAGGYIVAPPSVREVDGVRRRYETIALAGAGSPVDAQTIRTLLTPARPPRPKSAGTGDPGSSVERLARWLAQAPEGNRNASLFWAACRLAEAGLEESGIVDALHRPARATGLADREIETTIRSAWRVTQLTADSPDARSLRSDQKAVTL